MLYPSLQELFALKSYSKKIYISNPSNKVALGEHNSRSLGHGMEFAEVRRYSFGDDIRHIDWNVTARTNKPYSKLFKAETDNLTTIILDINKYMQFGTQNTFKSVIAAKITAAIGFGCINQGDRVSSILFGSDLKQKVFAPSKLEANFLRTLKILSSTMSFSDESEVNIDTVFKNHAHLLKKSNNIIVISDTMTFSKESLSKLNQFKKNSKITIVDIYDPADINLPSFCNTRLCSSESNLLLEQTTSNMINNYKSLWEDANNIIGEFTKKNNISRIHVCTKDDIMNTISKCLGRH